MKNSEKFYGEIRRYLKNVAEITGEYDTTMSRAEPYKGSEAHKRIEAEATAKRDAAVTAEKERTLAEIRAVIESMREHARTRKITAPTSEQLAILETLRMRQKISRDELQQAANNLRDCPLALSVLQELANAHHIVYTGGELGQTLTTDFIMQRIDCLEESTYKMIRGDNARFARVPADMGDCLTRWGAFSYKLDIDQWQRQSAVVDTDKITAFVAVVDGEEAET